MSEEAKAAVTRWFEVPNSHDASRFGEVCTSDYMHHDVNLPVPDADLATLEQLVGGMFAAFPDIHATVEDLVSEGDIVAARWSWTGTHTAELPGNPPLPATGKSVRVNMQSHHRVSGDKVAESWVSFDAMSMMKQLGVIPG